MATILIGLSQESLHVAIFSPSSTPCRKKHVKNLYKSKKRVKKMGIIYRDFMETDCIRLKRGVCRIDLKPCRERCPLRKTREEMEQQRRSNEV